MRTPEQQAGLDRALAQMFEQLAAKLLAGELHCGSYEMQNNIRRGQPVLGHDGYTWKTWEGTGHHVYRFFFHEFGDGAGAISHDHDVHGDWHAAERAMETMMQRERIDGPRTTLPVYGGPRHMQAETVILADLCDKLDTAWILGPPPTEPGNQYVVRQKALDERLVFVHASLVGDTALYRPVSQQMREILRFVPPLVRGTWAGEDDEEEGDEAVQLGET